MIDESTKRAADSGHTQKSTCAVDINKNDAEAQKNVLHIECTTEDQSPLQAVSSSHSVLPLSEASPGASLGKEGTERANVFKCFACNKLSVHTQSCFSVHCREKKNITHTYTSMTCHRCGVESSPCPNAKVAHPNKTHRLIWHLKTSQHTSEKVWELECEVCVALRLSRAQTRAQERARGETVTVTKLDKPATKWTRCNHCFALYKKGRGAKGVHTRASCKLFHPSADRTSRTKHFAKYVGMCEQLLVLNIFHHLPENLRKRVVAQCIGI